MDLIYPGGGGFWPTWRQDCVMVAACFATCLLLECIWWRFVGRHRKENQ